MSLLGKLFSGIPLVSALAGSSDPLDSNLEDHETYNLLFPDADALCHNEQVFHLATGANGLSSTPGAFDVNTDIDLDMRHVRVVIMQESSTKTSDTAYLLYDSHPAPLPQSLPLQPAADRPVSNNTSSFYSKAEGRRSMSSLMGQSARPAAVQQDVSSQTPPSPSLGAFGRRSTPKIYRSELSEGEKEIAELSKCIFGASDLLAYKGSGTKVHILPADSRPLSTGSSSFAADSSLSRARGSKLSQSFTSEHMTSGPTSTGFSGSNPTSRGSDRKKVLVTRMFPVPLPSNDVEDIHSCTPKAAETSGYPFPNVGESNGLNGTAVPEQQPKQKRTPMYAVAMLIHLPSTPRLPSAPVSRSSFRGPGSDDAQGSISSSCNSSRRAGWTMLGSGFGIESLESSFYSDVDDRIDLITHHWDVIMRTLSHLQAVATTCLLPLLRKADLAAPDPRRASVHNRGASVSRSGKRVLDEAKSHKTNAKLVMLPKDCLMKCETIQKEVEASRQRIVSGIKTTQVVTGQGRWGIWREEARLAEKLTGRKDHEFFFYNLLTGFLGIHTEWLQALGPDWYRKRHHQLQKVNKDDEVSLPSRTIIVSNDKIAARRLIFLLAAFLPADQQPSSMRMHRPSTSASFGALSQSPPVYATAALREESLLRRLNKRAPKANHGRALSFCVNGTLAPSIDSDRGRCPSETLSIRATNLPIPGSDIVTRKSSAATTSTATPVTTASHFARRPTRGTGPMPRPGSSGSLAADDLMRSLHRESSSSSPSQQGSGWGSVISGFWTRRGSSTTSNMTSASDGVEIHDPHYKMPISPSRGRLQDMVIEASQAASQPQSVRQARHSDTGSTETAKAVEDDEEQDCFPRQIMQVPERIPDPSGAFESPVKTSISEDGIIDIDVALPEYLTFDTAISSPSSSGILSLSGLGNGMDGFEQHLRPGPDVERSLNVGGWLPRYHPDFAMQAVPSSGDLIADIKASMRAESTPSQVMTPLATADQWVDVCRALIADTTSFGITHIRYQRLVRPKYAENSTPPVAQSFDSRYGRIYSTALGSPEICTGYVDERFVEEKLSSKDITLTDAVDKIIAQSGPVTRLSSPASSRSTSRRGEGRVRSSSDTQINLSGVPTLFPEVPRNECKKMVLTALDKIVTEVTASRNGNRKRNESESFLREGVRSWLSHVDGLD